MSQSFRNSALLKSLTLSVLLSALPTTVRAADEVTIPDSNLKAVLTEILERKSIEGELFTKENLQKIFYLKAVDRDIVDLTGLEHCVSLAEVRLSKNAVENVSALSGCTNIQSLDVANNKLKSIESLRELTKLQYLNVEANEIETLDAVSGMKSLAALYADDNQIKSLKPLVGLPKLHSLYVSGNQLSDLQPVATLERLDSLDVSRNRISDVSPLRPLKNLRFTFLMNNQISDIGPLAELAAADAETERRFAPFWRLYLARNPLDGDQTAEHLETLKSAGVHVDRKYVRHPDQQPQDEEPQKEEP